MRHCPLRACTRAGETSAASPTAKVGLVTTREKLHQPVDELNEAEVQAALARLVRDREAIERRTETEDSQGTAEAWAVASAREAIREEPW